MRQFNILFRNCVYVYAKVIGKVELRFRVTFRKFYIRNCFTNLCLRWLVKDPVTNVDNIYDLYYEEEALVH